MHIPNTRARYKKQLHSSHPIYFKTWQDHILLEDRSRRKLNSIARLEELFNLFVLSFHFIVLCNSRRGTRPKQTGELSSCIFIQE